jgi:hypothetical protein
MRQICHEHCPKPGGGLLATAAAVLGGLGLAAVFVVTHLWLVLGGLAAVAAAVYGLQRLLLHWTVLEMPRRGPAVSRAALPAPERVRAIPAPRRRAIESARRVIPGVVVSEEHQAPRRG